MYVYSSPIGKLGIDVSEKGLRKIEFLEEDVVGVTDEKNEFVGEVEKQLNEYFRGERKSFTLPLNLYGTPFQLKVWEALQTIPYGETRTYKEIAVQIGNPKGYRAVGMANNKNLIPIIIPCHRVIGENGKLVGYAGGVEKKEYLLKMENTRVW